MAGAGWASLFIQRCIAVVAWAIKEAKNGWMTDPSSRISTETRTRILVLQYPNSNPKHHLLLNLIATVAISSPACLAYLHLLHKHKHDSE